VAVAFTLTGAIGALWLVVHGHVKIEVHPAGEEDASGHPAETRDDRRMARPGAQSSRIAKRALTSL
jgi:hypothetical protein